LSLIYVSAPRVINGIIFSDLGQAAKFMALDWVQKALAECLDFAPFPATLNVRPADREDARVWESVKNDASLFFYMPSHAGSCKARVYRVAIQSGADGTRRKTAGAVLVPEIVGYPKDKIEIVAPTRLKDTFGVKDGDPLTLEFIH
jgi:CTP-dependent riboflavin kinase